MLLDEPFSNLDAGMRQSMRREVQAILRENGIAAIFVTHDREEAFATADRIGVMRGGRLEQIDAPDVVYHSPATPFVAEMAGTSDFLPGEIHGGFAVTEIGRLPFVNGNGRLSDGDRVMLLVRPDDFQIVQQEGGPRPSAHASFGGTRRSLTSRLRRAPLCDAASVHTRIWPLARASHSFPRRRDRS